MVPMKHWAFDLDGTLVDSFGHYFDALRGIFSDHGAEFAPDQRLPALTESVIPFLTRHLGPARVDTALQKLQAVSNADAEKIRPFDGVVDLISHLRGNGSQIAVWTNRDLESTRLILKHSGLDPLVDLCVSGSCVENRKPDPEGLTRITRQFGCRAERGDHGGRP